MIWITRWVRMKEDNVSSCGFQWRFNGYSPVTLFAPASIALSNNSFTALARSVIACPATILPIAAVGMGRMRRCCCVGSFIVAPLSTEHSDLRVNDVSTYYVKSCQQRQKKFSLIILLSTTCVLHNSHSFEGTSFFSTCNLLQIETNKASLEC